MANRVRQCARCGRFVTRWFKHRRKVYGIICIKKIKGKAKGKKK